MNVIENEKDINEIDTNPKINFKHIDEGLKNQILIKEQMNIQMLISNIIMSEELDPDNFVKNKHEAKVLEKIKTSLSVKHLKSKKATNESNNSDFKRTSSKSMNMLKNEMTNNKIQIGDNLEVKQIETEININTEDNNKSDVNLINNIKSKNKIDLKHNRKLNIQTNINDDNYEDESDEDRYIKITLNEHKRKLIKYKLVYDSLSDPEADEYIDNECIIYPNSYFKYSLEFLLLIFNFYCLLITPIILISDQVEEGNVLFFFLELLIDSIYIIDTITGFFTCYYDKEENLICNKKLIWQNYIKGWFFIDLISSIPFNTTRAYLYYFEIWKYRTFSIYKILVLLRCLKIYKIISYNKNLIDLSHLFTKSTTNRFIYSFILFLIISHILSCIFIFLTFLDYPNWIIGKGLGDSDIYEQYVASLYFNLTSIFTIGYGDILSVSLVERIYNILVLMVGILIYSYTVSSLSNYIQESDAKTLKFRNQMSYLDYLKIKYRINQTIYTKIVRFLKYSQTINKIDKNTIFDELPVSLKNDIMYFIHNDIIESFHFFKDNRNNLEFITRVLDKLKPIRAYKNDILIKEGDMIEEMIFVKFGLLALEITLDKENKLDKADLHKHNKNIIDNLIDKKLKKKKYFDIRNESLSKNKHKLIDIRMNEHFGEFYIFNNKRSQLRVRVKSKVADLFLLKKFDLLNIAVDYIDIFNQILNISNHNIEKINKLIDNIKSMYHNTIDVELKNTKSFWKLSNEMMEFNNKNKLIDPMKALKEDAIKKKINEYEISIEPNSCLKKLDLNTSNRDKFNELDIIPEECTIIEKLKRDKTFKYEMLKSPSSSVISSLYDLPSINHETNTDRSFVPNINQIKYITPYLNMDEKYNRYNTISIFGYYSNNLDTFVIKDGYLFNRSSDNIENKIIKVESLSWLNKEVINSISFSLSSNKKINNFESYNANTLPNSNFASNKFEDYTYIYKRNSNDYDSEGDYHKNNSNLVNFKTYENKINQNNSENTQNILQNSLNINNPNKYYKNWLKNNFNRRNWNKHIQYSKYTKKLTRLEEMFSKIHMI